MLTTENLILKPTTPLDLDIYLQILGSDELTKYLPKGSAYSKEEIEQYVTNRVLHWKHGFGSYVVYLKQQPLQKNRLCRRRVLPRISTQRYPLRNIARLSG
jgi:ribosomal-protein-alanine N-acetyltransferase